MPIETKGFPPDRESAVAELNVRDGGTVAIPAEVFREHGELHISIFAPDGGVAWQFPLDDWLAGIQHAVEALGPL